MDQPSSDCKNGEAPSEELNHRKKTLLNFRFHVVSATEKLAKQQAAAETSYNQNFKARFGRLCKTLRKLSKENEIALANANASTTDDVDFVLIVEKKRTHSLSFRLANYIARRRGREEITEEIIEKAREDYLKGLKEEFKVDYYKVDSDERIYYVIQLSFHHLGLMMELLGYRWPLRSIDSSRKAYKTFFFMKRNVPRYREYQLDNDKTRASFPARWRYNLIYYFLMGATVQMPIVSPWRNAVKETFKEQTARLERANNLDELEQNTAETEEATTKREKGYSLLQLFTDGVFDDWMVPHSQSYKEPGQEVNQTFRQVAHAKNCCTAGCAFCFFPTVTCQWTSVKTKTLARDFPYNKPCCCNLGVALWYLLPKILQQTLKYFHHSSIWRSFWYNNLINGVDMTERKMKDGKEENTRDFFGRTGTARNAVHFFPYQPPSEEMPGKMRHILPLDKLKDYLGEKIGLYFGWVELFILSLIFPSLIGIGMFICGVAYYSWSYLHAPDDVQQEADDYVGYIFAKACDNYATPAFAAIMIIWGTTFYELWNRRQKWYAFTWQVESLEQTELERPPVYSFKFAAYLRKSKFGAPIMYLPSIFFTLFFIGLVFLSVYFINVMNIFSVEYCPKTSSRLAKPIQADNATTPSPMATTTESDDYIANTLICNLFAAGQVLANSVSMFILDAIYTRLCYWLTDIEGHLTQSEYTDALIFKLFTFRFFNYYLVLFYIAFGVATHAIPYPSEITGGKGHDYESYGCGEQPCMALLSRQLLSVIVTQPLLNSIIDVTLPILKLIFLSVKGNRKSSLVQQEKIDSNQVDPNVEVHDSDPNSKKGDNSEQLKKELDAQYRLMELSTLDRKEFTAEEFTDKLIVFGALVMFSVALPPAPALAFLIIRIDLNLDLGRLMTRFRRPIPLRAQDIGMWSNIVNFLTYLGIITNPLIVILTSSWGSRFDIWWKFVLFLVVEHVIFAIRMLVGFLVPDIPKSLLNQQQIHKLAKDEVQAALIREKTESAIPRLHH